MPTVQPVFGIRKLGFRRWFERQLIECHIYLVTSFLCLILVLAVFEELSSRGGLERALMYGLMLCSGALGLISFERYRVMLLRALHFSERSNCGECGTYAQFKVLDSARPGPAEGSRDSWFKVRCGKCGHEWLMD